ncbi:hypothetical protein PG990_002784 [Apiospora arundinis]
MSSQAINTYSQLAADEANLVWCGHMPCIGASSKGCDCHDNEDTDAFYNPLLPPNAPLRLRYDGGQPQVVERRISFLDGGLASGYSTDQDEKTTTGKLDDEKATMGKSDDEVSISTGHQSTKKPGFFRNIPTRIHKLLPHDPCSPPSYEASQVEANCSKKVDPVAPSAELVAANDEPMSPHPFWSKAMLASTSNPDISYYPGQNPRALSAWKRVTPNLLTVDAVPITKLPFDNGSFATLAPLHHTLPYHLGFYHLAWMRECMEKMGTWKGCAHLLDCRGKSLPSQKTPGYTWSNEVYYSQSFLQKQEITYRVDSQSTGARDIDITMCPHITVSLANVRVTDEEDGIMASAYLSYSPARYDGDKGTYWASDPGRGILAELHNCTTCQCDLEQVLDIRGHELRVRFTVYRDLGSGVGRFDPYWSSHLTGEESLFRRQSKFRYDEATRKIVRQDVLGTYGMHWRVWGVAYRLRRPNLHAVTFTLANSYYNVLVETEAGDRKAEEKSSKGHAPRYIDNYYLASTN